MTINTKHKSPIKHAMICVSLSAALALSACGSKRPSTPEIVGGSAAEVDLRNRSQAIQKTLVEAVAVGALAGAVVGLLDRDENGKAFQGNGIGGYLLAGAAVGAAAGSYVAFLQDDFASKEERLARARADIQANNAELTDTLTVMLHVRDRQVAELRTLRAAVANGTADSAQLDREIAEARANIQTMEAAADGAAERRDEFAKAKKAVAIDDGANNIDGELAELGSRIAQMRQVADELAAEI